MVYLNVICPIIEIAVKQTAFTLFFKTAPFRAVLLMLPIAFYGG
jgi:hypothetical protein